MTIDELIARLQGHKENGAAGDSEVRHMHLWPFTDPIANVEFDNGKDRVVLS